MRHLIFRIENYTPLIRKISNKHWNRLPSQVQAWVTRDDFAQDGISFVRSHLMPRYNPRRDAKFSTYIFTAVHRYYRAEIESLTCEKRTMTVDARRELAKHTIVSSSLFTDGLDGMDSIMKLYDSASPCLRQHMDQWFFSQDGPKKIVKTSSRFKRARAEFLERAPRFGVTVEVVRDVVLASRLGVFEPELYTAAIETAR